MDRVLRGLTDGEKDVVRRCLVAILHGPFIDDWEFHTRLGLNRRQLQAVLQSWPNLDDSAEESVANLAVNNCMNEVCHGVQIPAEHWSNWFATSRDEVQATYFKWAKLAGYSSRVFVEHTEMR